MAAPGDGGGGGYTSLGDKPGTASLTGAGGNATTPNDSRNGGGGGGAGVTGGAGGDSPGGGADGGAGGTHGYSGDGAALESGSISEQGANGGDGVDASNSYSGGGGGGGGGFGAVATGSSSLNVTSGSIAGGAGGAGGDSGGWYSGAGGSGGYGFVLNTTTGTHTIGASVTGGDGGNGGTGDLGSFNDGGDAGDGIFVTGHSSPVTLVIQGTVTGGDGGDGGSVTGSYSSDGGDAGSGVKGRDINVVLTGGAAVAGGAGGTSDTGSAGSNGHAIAFSGGTNSLELQATAGGSIATLTGGISHSGSSDVLKLGGSNNADFALSGLGGTFKGFGSYEKTGTATWTLTGTTASTKGWTVSSGVLKLQGGSIAGATTISSGATLQFDQTADTTHAASIGGAGGLKKTGSGTLSLTGANTYSGGTAIEGGVLLGSSSSIRGNVAVSSGAVVDFKETSDITNANVISGAGRLKKSGNGTLTMTGANTYSGGTAIEGGVLLGSSSSIRGNVAVSSGAVVDFKETSDITNANVISGAGRLKKSGSGTLSLTGANTYSGGTAIEGGVLLGSSSSIRGNVAVSSGAVVDFKETSDITNANVISGAGRLQKSGSGTLSLTGANTYSGGTAIEGGILSGSSSSIRGNVAVSSGAVVNFKETSDTTNANVISGGGRLQKSGSGTLTLTGANTYSGGTAIKAGTLIANTTSILGDIDIGSGATMRFNQDVDGNYSGGISGSGSLEKFGAGSLSLIGAYTFTGETKVLGGQLLIGGANLTSSSSFALTGGSLTISGDDAKTIRELKVGSSSSLNLDGGSLTVSQAINSTQHLSLTGTGTLNLDQAGNTLGGGVTLQNGSLVVGTASTKKTASLAADVSVSKGAILGGHGSITGTVTNNGRIAPGNSIGTLTVNGDLSGSGTLEIEVDGDTSGTPSADKVIVNGAVDVSAMTLDLVLSPTDAAHWAYGPTGPFTIIENDGTDAVVGTFATVTDNLMFLDPSLNYTAGTGNDVQLKLLRNNIDMVATAQTVNQIATAAAIETLGDTNPVYKSVVTTVSDKNAARVAFDSLSGEINATLRSVLVSDSDLTRDMALTRLRDSGSSGSGLWGNAIGNWGHYGSNRGTYDADSTTGGFLIGYDHTVSQALMLGVMAGYTRTDVSVNQLNSKAEADSFHLGFYAGGAWNGLTYKGGVATAYNDADVDRDVRATSTLSQLLTSDQQIYSTQVFAETGYEFDVRGVTLEPFAGVAQLHLASSGFTEKGGSAALTATGQGDDTSYLWVGLRTAAAFDLFGATATAKASVAWQHASEENATFNQAFASGGDRFKVIGAPFSRDTAQVDAGLGIDLGENMDLDFSYSGRLASQTQNHGLNARLSIRF